MILNYKNYRTIFIPNHLLFKTMANLLQLQSNSNHWARSFENKEVLSTEKQCQRLNLTDFNQLPQTSQQYYLQKLRYERSKLENQTMKLKFSYHQNKMGINSKRTQIKKKTQITNNEKINIIQVFLTNFCYQTTKKFLQQNYNIIRCSTSIKTICKPYYDQEKHKNLIKLKKQINKNNELEIQKYFSLEKNLKISQKIVNESQMMGLKNLERSQKKQEISKEQSRQAMNKKSDNSKIIKKNNKAGRKGK